MMIGQAMPTENTLNWADAATNGHVTVGSGETSTGVTIATNTNAAGETGSITTQGSPAEDALWVDDLTDAVTTTLTFDAPVENVSFEIFDLDENGTLWDERVTILATDAEGNVFPVSVSDLDGTHSVSDGIIDADGIASLTTDTTGADDSVSVSIAGPITSLEIIFENGEDAAQTGKIGLSDISFSNAPDGIVEGSAAAELIDSVYTGDPEGDVVTNAGTQIEAGGGNDTVFSGTGNDSVLGGDGDDLLVGEAGDDTLEGGDGNDTLLGYEGNDVFIGGDGNDSAQAGEGNDVFYGGQGDDWVNGDLGNDELHGGTGNDFLRGSFGNDTIHSGGTGEGDDYLWGGYGDDRFVITDGFGNDTIAGENIDEVDGDTVDLSAVTTGVRLDLTNGASGIGTFSDGTSTTEFEAIENIELSAGQDTVVLADGSGSDTVTGFVVPTDNGDGTFTAGDLLDVTALTSDSGATPITSRNVTVSEDADGNAVLSFPGGESLTLEGVAASSLSSPEALESLGIPEAPDGYFTGSSGDDVINVGDIDADGDLIDGGDAALPGSTGDDDHVQALDGNDLVFSGAGDDIVEGGTGNDTVYASVGDDTIYGGEGDDKLVGEDGNDAIYSGTGADEMDGGADRDTFFEVNDGDTIFGGETGDDFDTINLTGSGDHRVTYDVADAESGTIEFLDTDGNVTGSAHFEGIERIVPCFTPGTLIATETGARNVSELKVGDLLHTRDHGLQKIRWIGTRHLSKSDLNETPFLQPVLIRAGALGNALPDRDMMVSPNHRVLVTDAKAELLFGEAEILVAAKHLIGTSGIEKAEVADVTYVHFMFERHEIVMSDGLWSESFQPGLQALAGLDAPQRDEIYTLFPELMLDPSSVFATARPVARKREAQLLFK
ncbi:MAG: Hint domain-containing protein [Cognatishimia sp.]